MDRSRHSFSLEREGVANNTLGERDRLRGAYLYFGGVACCVSGARQPSYLRSERIYTACRAALLSRVMGA